MGDTILEDRHPVLAGWNTRSLGCLTCYHWMSQKRAKECNGDYQRQVSGFLSSLGSPMPRRRIYTLGQAVPFCCCNGATEKCTPSLHTVSCFTLFTQNQRQPCLPGLSAVLSSMSDQTLVGCFCLSSPISFLACDFPDQLDNTLVWDRIVIHIDNY